jgi:hypothetical protein
MVGYDSRKIAQNPEGVKRDFGFPLLTFFRLRIVRDHNILGVLPEYEKWTYHAKHAHLKIPGWIEYTIYITINLNRPNIPTTQ